MILLTAEEIEELKHLQVARETIKVNSLYAKTCTQYVRLRNEVQALLEEIK